MARVGGTPENLIPAKKGDPSRNPKGRPPMPDLRGAIADILNEQQNGMSALEAILKALFKRALSGDVRAAQELLDRGFGKSQQSIQHSGELKTINEPTLTNEQLQKLIDKL